MECPYCKAQNRAGVRYCSNCGKFIGGPTATGQTGTTGGIPRSLLPGARLQGGRYLIEKVLGQGGMGTALLAIDNRLDGKLVVIKELISDNVDPAKFQDDVRNFKREVATLAHIDHPLVPNVTDHFQEGTRYFMVQEYVDGENLEEFLKRTQQPMRERETLLCASEILDVLDYLSLQTPPIVHRDIKPDNIIIGTKDRRAHLVDFGIARAEVARNAQKKQTSALGTPGYAPPEQYQGNADPRSDLYALGATLHHLLTNRDPRNFAPFSYPPVRSINPQLSPEIEQVLIRALKNDKDERYQSADAMKQDIDTILQQHFGVVSATNSYTLGTSGSMKTITASSLASMPTISNPVSLTPTPPQIPATPLPPTMLPQQAYAQQNVAYPQPVTPNYLSNMGQPAPPPRRNNTVWIVISVLAIVLLLSAALLGYFNLAARGNQTVTATPTATPATNGIGVTKIGNEYIGISDGTFIFDTVSAGAALKQQAAQHLKQNPTDMSTAIALYAEAISKQTNDAEALIYQEDLRVLNSGSPYVTLVVGTMLSGNYALLSVGRDDLQGAYVAQKEFNDGSKLHGGVQVRLLIANSGSQTAYTNQLARQIVQLAKTDKTFVGVMGWPYSSRAVQEIGILGQAHIPMVSNTASSDQLTHASPYFFRVAPSNKTQGRAGAKYAEQTLHAKAVALFYDPTDPYSQSLADDFSQQFKADGNQIVDQETYTVGKSTNYADLLQKALAAKPDLIYFSGYASDISKLLINLPAGNLPVMGGDALYELGGYSSDARAGFSRLHFTTFAYPDEWDVLGYSAQKPAFFGEYGADFDPQGLHRTHSPYGFVRPDSDAMLSYDAMVALLRGCDLALSSGKQTITADDLRQGLSALNGANAFQGVSGEIAFGADGDPVNKTIVVLHVNQGHVQMEPVKLGHFLR